MRQREPRERDPAYLGWVAGLPCIATLIVQGTYLRGVHVAHLRTGSLEHGKRPTGGAEKPSDAWVTPLAPQYHTGDLRKAHFSQHTQSEEDFWEQLGVNPFELCIALRKAYCEGRSGHGVIATFAARARKRRSGL